jgi:hypothetical protein
VEVAGLATVEAVVLAILHQADVVLALAQNAIALAVTKLLRPAALVTDKFFSHGDSDFSFFFSEMKV